MASQRSPKVYLAAPFFSKEQIKVVEELEATIEASGWRMFSPRKGENALRMNGMIANGTPPDQELRLAVFTDNVVNIDDSDLMLAVIDDRDSGVMFEIGYAYRASIPIVTYTSKNYGSNLMLAHSIIGHTKIIESVREVLRIGNPHLALERKVTEYGAAVAEIQFKFKSTVALKEGPDEHKKVG